MKSVRQFELAIEPVQKIKVPFNSELLRLSVTLDGKPVVFILVDGAFDEGARYPERTFHIFATEKEVNQRFNKSHYVGSFEHKSEAGSHVLHVFEER